MSYCRFSDDSEVYMFHFLNGKIVCCACRLNRRDKWGHHPDTILNNPKDAWKHLKEHIYVGHKVPKYATDRLKEEISK